MLLTYNVILYYILVLLFNSVGGQLKQSSIHLKL